MCIANAVEHEGLSFSVISVLSLQFCQALTQCLGTKGLSHSTACRPQTDGHTEGINRIPEDMPHWTASPNMTDCDQRLPGTFYHW